MFLSNFDLARFRSNLGYFSSNHDLAFIQEHGLKFLIDYEVTEDTRITLSLGFFCHDFVDGDSEQTCF